MNLYLRACLLLVLIVSCGGSEQEVFLPESTTQEEAPDDAIKSADSVASKPSEVQRSTDSSPLQAIDGSSFRILVLGLSRNGPQADVAVRSCPESLWQSQANQAAWANQGSPSQEVLQLPTYRTLGDGVAKFPTPDSEPIIVVAERDGRWVWQRIENAKDGTMMRLLFPDEASFALRVIDQDGKPAVGVPVLPFVGPRISMDIETGTEIRFSRAPDALVYLSDIKFFRDVAESMSKRMAEDAGHEVPPPAPLRAYADLLLIEDMFVELPLPTPKGVIDFQLGPTGSLRVDIVGIDDAAGVASIHGTADAPYFYGTSAKGLAFQNGVLEVPYVGLGLDLNIAIQLEGESGKRRIHVAGPQSAGEHVQATLVIDPTMIVSGRLLDSRGRPITGKRVNRAVESSSRDKKITPPALIVFAGQRWPRSHELSLDENGRFRAIVNFEEFGEKVYAVQIQFANKALSWTGELPMGPGETDLGDVQLDAGPVLLAGRVVNPKGEGIAGVELTLEFERPWQNRTLWMEYPGASLVSAKDGGFRVPYSYDRGAGRMTARHDAYSQKDPFLVQSGDMDIELPMEMGGELLLTYSAPDGYNDYGLQLILSGPEGVLEAEPDDGYFSQDLSYFRYRGVPPGEYRVALKSDNFKEELLVITGVLIEAGKLCEDARLHEVDLSPTLREISVAIRNQRGEAQSDFDLYVVQDGDAEYLPGLGYQQSFWAPVQAKFDVEVFSEEYGLGSAQNIGSAVDIELFGLQSAHLKVADDVNLDTAGGRLHLTLSREPRLDSFDYKFMPWDPQPIDASRTFSSPIPGPGRYTLHWHKGKPDRMGGASTSLVLTAEDLEGTIVVHPPDDFQ